MKKKEENQTALCLQLEALIEKVECMKNEITIIKSKKRGNVNPHVRHLA